MSVGIGSDKAPAVTCAWRSDGETIPWVDAAGGKAIGDVVVRVVADQAIGVVSALQHDYPATSTAGDEIQLRIEGMFYVPKATGALNDGARVAWVVANTNVAANATGAHQVVGQYASAATHALVRINKFPGTVA